MDHRMLILRWLAFLPVGFIALSMGQLATSQLAQWLNGFILAVVVIFFGILWVGAGVVSVLIAPSRKTAAIIMGGIFVTLEVAALTIDPPSMSGSEMTARIWTDLNMLTGIVIGGFAINKTH